METTTLKLTWDRCSPWWLSSTPSCTRSQCTWTNSFVWWDSNLSMRERFIRPTMRYPMLSLPAKLWSRLFKTSVRSCSISIMEHKIDMQLFFSQMTPQMRWRCSCMILHMRLVSDTSMETQCLIKIWKEQMSEMLKPVFFSQIKTQRMLMEWIIRISWLDLPWKSMFLILNNWILEMEPTQTWAFACNLSSQNRNSITFHLSMCTQTKTKSSLLKKLKWTWCLNLVSRQVS